MDNVTTDKLRQNLIFQRPSGILLVLLSVVLLITISILGLIMFSQTEALRRNVEITQGIVNANIRTLGQVQRELFRLKVSLLDGSDDNTVSLYRSFASQRINEVTLSYNEATLGSDELLAVARDLVMQWENEIEPIIEDIIENDSNNDTDLREQAIALIDAIELEFNNLASDGEINRKTQAGAANDAAITFAQSAQFIMSGLAFTVISYLIIVGIAAIDYMRFDQQREQTNRDLNLQQARLRSLLEIATQSADATEQFNQIVKQATQSLGMEVGIISHILGNGYTVMTAYAPNHPIESGMTCDLDATLCKKTVDSGNILSMPDIASVIQMTNPCFEGIMPQSYIGTPIIIKGKTYGTLSFISEEVRENAFSDSDKDFVRILGEWINVSLERQQTRDELASYASNLEKSNAELQQFAYAASHDLQEPLRKIQTFGSRLEAKYSEKLDDRGNEYLKRMQNAAGRMQVLIQDLLSLSRVTTQAQPLEDTNLNKVIEGVLSDIEVQIENANAEIIVESLPKIKADDTQMRQLFQNLISNGIKFAREDVPPQIIIDSKIHTNKLIPEIEIYVRDNGIGFDPQYSERIFSVFQRLHGRGDYEGTGVGLALCRKIVERHNGTIIANGIVGEGATFVITLPMDNI